MSDENNIYDYDPNEEVDEMDLWSIEDSADLNGDGIDDAFIESVDMDGDGNADMLVYSEDIDFDGNIDVTLMEADTNADGMIDYSEARYISYEEDMSRDEYYVSVEDTDFDGEFDDVDFGVDEYSNEDIIYDEETDYAEVDYSEADSTETDYAEVDYSETDSIETDYAEVDYSEAESTEADYAEVDEEADTVVYGYDLDNDGTDDLTVSATDTDGDGIADIISYAGDLDGDGRVDIVMTEADTNNDGVADTTEVSYISYNEDGSSDEYFVKAADLDFDGEIDDVDYGVETHSAEEVDGEEYTEEITNEDSYDEEEYIEEDEYVDEIESEDDTLVLPSVDYDTANDNGAVYTDLDNFDASNADAEGVIGEPEDALDLWEYQGDTYRCALYAQKFVIEEYTGEEVDIEDLVDMAEDNGWFSEGSGTPLNHMDKILDSYDIPNETSYGNTMEDLVESLNDGNRVIVAVDADEYWTGENDSDVYTPGDGVTHAVEVIGIDNTDPDNPMVILNDSGMPNGAGVEVPMETFMDAWEDGNNYMIECYIGG
ncbi:MAG: hypothetical protein E7415_01020 [Ruminococcaceae bacterium]|nr:hypothetical protein [Oscillospiraceae bacterium]